MNLKVLGSSSSGNCYHLTCSKGKTLIIDAGISLLETKKELGFELSGVEGLIATHFHGDHIKYGSQYVNSGIPVYSNKSTIDFLGGETYNKTIMNPKQVYRIGDFKVMPFDLKHDVPCFGFLINHEECGNVVFITDSYYSPYTFDNVNFWIVEANYSKEIVDKKYLDGKLNPFLRNRILKSHLSIENCAELLKVNDLRQTRKIVLIHLSDANSSEKEFKSLIENETKKEVIIADNGVSVDFNLFDF